jgi:hypothetical protein
MKMSRRYLEVTFRNGRPFAAYLYLPRLAGDRATRTVQIGPGMMADFASDGRCIGVELLDPATVTAEALNVALRSHLTDAIRTDELRPLAA